MSGIQTPLISTLCLAAGFILGSLPLGSTGKTRARMLISYLANQMEVLRMKSKLKAAQKDAYLRLGKTEEAQKLENDLLAESEVFLSIQHSISDWCYLNNEKDPFAL